MTDGGGSIEAGPWIAVNLAIEHATVGADLFDVVAASSVIQSDAEWSEDDAGMDITRGALRREISEARRRIVKDLGWPLAPRAVPGCIGLQWILGPGGYQSTVNVVVPAGEWCWVAARQIRTLNLGGARGGSPRGVPLSGTIKVEDDGGGRFRLTVPDVEGVKWIGIGSVQAQLLQPKEGSSEQQLVGADPRKLVAELDAEAIREDDGMLRADAALARELDEAKFPEAKDFRAARRNALSEFKEGKRDAARLWAYWLPVTTGDGSPGNDPARDLLARALWPAVRKRRIGHRPAVTRVVATESILPSMSRQIVIPSADDGVIRDRRGRQLGAFDVAAVDSELVRTGLHAMGSVAGHRTINAIVHSVHRQHEARDPDWRSVNFEGGWAGLKEAIGMPNATNSELRAILEAGQWVQWKARYLESGGFWTWTAIRGSKARCGLVRIIAGDMLSPGLAPAMKGMYGNSKAARRARKLIPELRHEPPLDAMRRNERGRAWTVARMLVERLVDQADQIINEGGVLLTDDDWREWACDVGLSAGVVPKLRESWITGTDTSPALIEETSPGRWVLAKDHAPELEFIKLHGNQILSGEKGGRASQKRREAQRAGSVPKRRKK